MDLRFGPPPDMAAITSYSLNPPIRLVTTAVVIDGISSGTVTFKNSFIRFAPSSRAASLYIIGILWRPAR